MFKGEKEFFQKGGASLKKKIFLITVTFVCLALLYGCNSQEPEFDVDVGEEQFAATIDGILENFDNYVGKTVRLEGVFEYFGEDPVYRYVLRRAGTC